MLAASKHIVSSGAQLRTLLARTGRSLKQGDCLDKLEVLEILADQITDKLTRGGKTKLTLGDLNSFLSREGLEEEHDFKGVVSKIFQLKYAQHARLQEHVRPRSQGRPGHPQEEALDCMLALVAMDAQRVNDCFDLTVWSSPSEQAEEREESQRPQSPCELTGVSRTLAATPRDNSPMNGSISARDDDSGTRGTVRASGPNDDALETPLKRRRKSFRRREIPALEFSATDFKLLEDLTRLVPTEMLAVEDSLASCRSVASQSERKDAAQKEIERILSAETQSQPILVGHTSEERRAVFRRIVLLLHPDLGLVPADDARAIKAIVIALRDFVQSEKAGPN